MSTGGRLTFPKIVGWELTRVLGSGGQAIVYLGHRANDETLRAVIKVLRQYELAGKQRSEELQRGRFDLEISTMLKLNTAGCPRIVRILDACRDVMTDPHPWYVMPYYEGGPMCRRDEEGRVVAWAEVYRGNVDRVLEIAEFLTETLMFMHELGVGHRDVHTSNVFFETVGGLPILGDFGLVHDEDAMADMTGQRDGFGPWRWRPPELKAGSPNMRDSASDIYLLGGLIYEALTAGEYIESTQREDGSFVHELQEFSLVRHSADPRIPLVSKMLRGMLAMTPRARVTAPQLLESLRKIRKWKPDQPSPVILPSQVLLASLAERARQVSPAYHAERIPPLLLNGLGPAVERLVKRYPSILIVKGTGGDLLTRSRLHEIKKHEFTTVVSVGKAESSDPTHLLEGQYPGFFWVRAWMKVFYGPQPEVESGAWLFVGRSAEGRQVIIEVRDNLTARLVSNSYADDPMEEQTFLDALEGMLEWVTSRAADTVERGLRQS